MYSFKALLVFLLLNISTWHSHAEVFTALSDIEPLLETHKRIMDDLDTYVLMEEKRIGLLKKQLSFYKNEHEKAMEDIPNYLGNPINAFTLIKRLTTDLDLIEKGIKLGTEFTKNVTTTHPDVKYPSEEDLTGAAQAITRLKDTYHLDIAELSEGVLNGVEYSTPMRASDCFVLGRALYNEGDFKNALPWLMVALKKYNPDEDPLVFNEIEILEYIAYSHYLLGDPRTALKWTQELLKLDPGHDRAIGNIPHYFKAITELEAKEIRQLKGEIGYIDDDETPSPPSAYETERERYEELCRGGVEVPVEVTSKLRCRYLTENHPFLKLAPFKVEQVYMDPDIFVFYEVLSDEEIESIKEMAKPRFKRAVVHDPKTGDLISAHYRISKSAWIKDTESELVAKVSRRVQDMTTLDMNSAEELQVVNYGIGGHYEPHFDFARLRETAFTSFPGNRIATVLFYMSDVAQGGATVFTELGLSVSPIKNSAVYWLNLHPSGEGNLATRHAACPVLRGSKWVCNKWIHQGGQELIKPCDLEYQAEGFIRQIAKPVPRTAR